MLVIFSVGKWPIFTKGEIETESYAVKTGTLQSHFFQVLFDTATLTSECSRQRLHSEVEMSDLLHV